MNDKDIDIWKEKTKGIFHITEHRRFWNYITNLQEELKEYKMIFDTFSKRPYAHRYLEEKKKELGNNKIIGLDSEMIYKDYYDLKEENERLKEIVENLTTMTVCGDRKQIKNTAQYKLDIYKQRIDKANEIIDEVLFVGVKNYRSQLEIIQKVINGGDEEC